jgi:pteridine reductase
MSNTRVALITGSAKRIGAAIVRRLHADGMNVVIHHRNSTTEATALAAELNAARANSALVLQAELSEFDRLPEMIAKVIGAFGRLDVLVNNASSFFPTPIGPTIPKQWDELFAPNAYAPFFLSQCAAFHLKRTQGCIINLLDIYAERPRKDHTVYVMSKAALTAMTKSLAVDLAPDVRVNGVALGAVLWPSDAPSENAQRILQRTPLARTGSAEEIADAVSWLAKPNFITGQIINVDGGRSVWEGF